MFSKALAAAILAGVALAQTFSINTPPSIQQCQPASLSWVGGTAPYILDAIPAGQVSAAAIANIAPSVTGLTYSWTVNLAQGTAITIKITDATGALAYSSPLTVQAGQSGCLSSSAASGASSASGATSSVSRASSASTTAAASTTSAAATTSSAGASTTSGTATTSRASTPATTSTGAAAGKAILNLPVLALGAVAGFAGLGGYVALF